MPRFFNTTGPCDPRWHYMLPPSQRLPDIQPLIDRMQYFVLHAARQVGKTTAMRAFAAELRTQGYVAVHATLETSQQATEVSMAEGRWLPAIAEGAAAVLPVGDQPPPVARFAEMATGIRLGAWLGAWATAVAPRKVVLLLDEADTVSGEALVNLLRQLRAGFNVRPDRFPSSVALIGMRDLRDYLTQAKDGSPVNPGSPFNITAASITMRNFTADEVVELLGQHTQETGQIFLPEASARIFDWTRGQPFLVNKLALLCMDDLCPDRAVHVSAAHIDEAKERLILARTTHLDALAERLKELRIATIVQAILLGDEDIDYATDDFQYAVDLGLIVRGPNGAEPANPLYREVLGRELTFNRQMNMPTPTFRWQTADNKLDFPALINEFCDYWRENADAITRRQVLYTEAVTHITFMAFLQRVVNGGGVIQREFAAGRGAVDVVAHFAGERFVTEIKRVRPKDGMATVRARGIAQLSRYLDVLGLDEGWLLVVDQRPRRTWRQRLWREDVTVEGRVLHLVGV